MANNNTTFSTAAGGGGGGLSGAALRRMQELAQSLYDSTPGLQEGMIYF